MLSYHQIKAVRETADWGEMVEIYHRSSIYTVTVNKEMKINCVQSLSLSGYEIPWKKGYEATDKYLLM